MPIRPLIAALRLLVLVPAVVVGVVATLVLVPLVETLCGCGEEWELAARRVWALARA